MSVGLTNHVWTIKERVTFDSSMYIDHHQLFLECPNQKKMILRVEQKWYIDQ